MVSKKLAACRADIPAMLSQGQRDSLVYKPQCRQRWGERHIEGAVSPLKAEDIEEFLTEFAWLKEKELALECLFDGEFDVPKAVGLLHAARRERYKTRHDLDKRLPFEALNDAVAAHGKKFHLVKQAVGEKVITREVVSRYYLWKRTDDFKKWSRHQKAMKTRKTKKEAERLRQWVDESDPETETFEVYHNRHCELCATGGSLLCCDGCPRAYHVSCAQPPITRLDKEEDWFCSHCLEEFGGIKPKLVPSSENDQCMVYVPSSSVPRSLMESMTDASSYEEEDEQEDYSDDENEDNANGESSGDSDSDDYASKCHSPKELSLNAANSGSLTDNESDSPSAKTPSTSLASGNAGCNKSELNPGPVTQLTPAAQQNSNETTAPSSTASAEQSVDASHIGARRTPVVQLERPGSGRKRHRKMLAPRRIPPSRFDG
ncbi:hypothetical protein L915_19562 [Phytophthora nicotianae]|uniref:PHD-type domain-containing protein n=2 Tax=Phytophthora nicotianae TaxID=4792 RepID=W2FSA9_PHYNI|nr:hypothetical protein L915_19562 [Phytophthora nicotianae]ETL26971.1 hypothetical protein L916_19450 [Phytophthora nicotianae]